MRRISLALIVLSFACSSEPDAQSPASHSGPSEAADPAPSEPAPSESSADHPVLVAICGAYDAEIEANPSPDQILSRTAGRAVANGLPESDLSTIGARPAEVSAFIRSHGSPERCAAFVEALDALH